eukprot:gene21784-27850_t
MIKEAAASQAMISSVEEPLSSQLPNDDAEWKQMLEDDSSTSSTKSTAMINSQKTDTSKKKSAQKKATTSTKSATAKSAVGKTATVKTSTAKTANVKSVKTANVKTSTARATTFDDDTDTFSASEDSSDEESEDESYKVGESTPDEISPSDQGNESASSSAQTAESVGSGEVLDHRQRRLQFVVAQQKIEEELGGATTEDVEPGVIDLVSSDTASLSSSVPPVHSVSKRGRDADQDMEGSGSNANAKRRNISAAPPVDPETPPFSPCEPVFLDPLSEPENEPPPPPAVVRLPVRVRDRPCYPPASDAPASGRDRPPPGALANPHAPASIRDRPPPGSLIAPPNALTSARDRPPLGAAAEQRAPNALTSVRDRQPPGGLTVSNAPATGRDRLPPGALTAPNAPAPGRDRPPPGALTASNTPAPGRDRLPPGALTAPNAPAPGRDLLPPPVANERLVPSASRDRRSGRVVATSAGAASALDRERERRELEHEIEVLNERIRVLSEEPALREDGRPVLGISRRGLERGGRIALRGSEHNGRDSRWTSRAETTVEHKSVKRPLKGPGSLDLLNDIGAYVMDDESLLEKLGRANYSSRATHNARGERLTGRDSRWTARAETSVEHKSVEGPLKGPGALDLLNDMGAYEDEDLDEVGDSAGYDETINTPSEIDRAEEDDRARNSAGHEDTSVNNSDGGFSYDYDDEAQTSGLLTPTSPRGLCTDHRDQPVQHADPDSRPVPVVCALESEFESFPTVTSYKNHLMNEMKRRQEVDLDKKGHRARLQIERLQLPYKIQKTEERDCATIKGWTFIEEPRIVLENSSNFAPTVISPEVVTTTPFRKRPRWIEHNPWSKVSLSGSSSASEDSHSDASSPLKKAPPDASSPLKKAPPDASSPLKKAPPDASSLLKKAVPDASSPLKNVPPDASSSQRMTQDTSSIDESSESGSSSSSSDSDIKSTTKPPICPPPQITKSYYVGTRVASLRSGSNSSGSISELTEDSAVSDEEPPQPCLKGLAALRKVFFMRQERDAARTVQNIVKDILDGCIDRCIDILERNRFDCGDGEDDGGGEYDDFAYAGDSEDNNSNGGRDKLIRALKKHQQNDVVQGEGKLRRSTRVIPPPKERVKTVVDLFKEPLAEKYWEEPNAAGKTKQKESSLKKIPNNVSSRKPPASVMECAEQIDVDIMLKAALRSRLSTNTHVLAPEGFKKLFGKLFRKVYVKYKKIPWASVSPHIFPDPSITITAYVYDILAKYSCEELHRGFLRKGYANLCITSDVGGVPSAAETQVTNRLQKDMELRKDELLSEDERKVAGMKIINAAEENDYNKTFMSVDNKRRTVHHNFKEGGDPTVQYYKSTFDIIKLCGIMAPRTEMINSQGNWGKDILIKLKKCPAQQPHTDGNVDETTPLIRTYAEAVGSAEMYEFYDSRTCLGVNVFTNTSGYADYLETPGGGSIPLPNNTTTLVGAWVPHFGSGNYYCDPILKDFIYGDPPDAIRAGSTNQFKVFLLSVHEIVIIKNLRPYPEYVGYIPLEEGARVNVKVRGEIMTENDYHDRFHQRFHKFGLIGAIYLPAASGDLVPSGDEWSINDKTQVEMDEDRESETEGKQQVGEVEKEDESKEKAGENDEEEIAKEGEYEIFEREREENEVDETEVNGEEEEEEEKNNDHGTNFGGVDANYLISLSQRAYLSAMEVSLNPRKYNVELVNYLGEEGGPFLRVTRPIKREEDMVLRGKHAKYKGALMALDVKCFEAAKLSMEYYQAEKDNRAWLQSIRRK